jgi:hypothetical protein
MFSTRSKNTKYQINFLDSKIMEHLLKNEPYIINFEQKFTEIRSKTKTITYYLIAIL